MEQDRSVSPEQIRWYLDGDNFFTVNANQVDATTWNNATHHGFFIILNVAIGGGFPAAFGGGPTGPPSPGYRWYRLRGRVHQWRRWRWRRRHDAAGRHRQGGQGVRRDVPGRARRHQRQRHPGAALHLQRHGSPAVDRGEAGSTLRAFGKCLDIAGGGTANGTKVQLWDCNVTAAQVFIPQGNGALWNPQSNRCLDDPGWSTTPGTQLQIWDCTGGANQKWVLNA